MKFLIKSLLLIAVLVMGAALVLPFLPGGQYFLDRVERKARMGWHQVFYRWNRPLPATPRLKKLKARLSEKGLKLGTPIFMRIFKKRSQAGNLDQGQEKLQALCLLSDLLLFGTPWSQAKTGRPACPRRFLYRRQTPA